MTCSSYQVTGVVCHCVFDLVVVAMLVFMYAFMVALRPAWGSLRFLCRFSSSNLFEAPRLGGANTLVVFDRALTHQYL